MTCGSINHTWENPQLIVYLPTFKHFLSFQALVGICGGQQNLVLENGSQLQLSDLLWKLKVQHSVIYGSFRSSAWRRQQPSLLPDVAGKAEPQGGRLGHSPMASLQP